jgi:hypothetical protein
MRNKILLFLLLAWLFILNYDLVFKYKDSFERLNGISFIDRAWTYVIDKDRYDRYLIVKEQYNRSIKKLDTPDIKTNSLKGGVPKTIHQIWFGSNLPAVYKFYRNKCIDLHPGWKFKLWSIEDVKKENFSLAPYLKEAISFAEMSDVVRYEIINRYGGFYLDMDVDCFRNLDGIADNFDYWFNTEAQISAVFTNAIFASKTGSDVFKKVLFKVKNNYEKPEEAIEKHNKKVNKFFRKHDSIASNHLMAVVKTMLPLGDSINEILDSNNFKERALVLPAAFCDKPYFFKASLLELWQRIKGILFYKQFIQFKKEDLYCAQFKKEDYKSYLSSPNFSLALTSKRDVSLKSMLINFYALNPLQLEAFKLLYDKNYPGRKGFSSEDIIAKNIYIMSNDVNKINSWQSSFPGFDVQMVNGQIVSDLLHKNGFTLTSDDRFNNAVAGILLLKEKGGILVNDNKLSPHYAYLRELANKYDAFFVTDPGERKKDILISGRIMGATKNYMLLEQILEKLKLENVRSYNQYQKIVSDIIYDQISFVARNTVVFPAAQFFGPKKNNASFTYEDN